MSTNYYNVSEYLTYQALDDMAVPDQVLDVDDPETFNYDHIKDQDRLEKLLGLEYSHYQVFSDIETPNVDYIKDRIEKLIAIELSDPEDETVSEPHKKNQTLIYRFSIPFKNSIAEYQKFNRDIEWIKNKNPKWEVLPDMPKLGEESAAWIMVYKDENYLNSRLSYLIDTSISSSLI